MFKQMMSFVAVAALVFALAPTASAVTIAPGNLLGYWNFDDATANDSSGNGNHGTTASSYSTDEPTELGGKSIDFAGAVAYSHVVTVSTGGTEDVFDLDTLSVGFWTLSPPVALAGYVGKMPSGITSGWNLRNSYDNDEDIQLLAHSTSGGYPWNTGAHPVTVNPWNYITFTYDGSNANMYHDGVLFATTGVTGSITDTIEPLRFGQPILSGGEAIPNTSKMDEITIFDRALTAGEVSDLYAQKGNPEVVPEPSTFLLAALGLLGMIGFRRRRNR